LTLERTRRFAGVGAAGIAWSTLVSLVLVGTMIAATSPAVPPKAALDVRLESALDALGGPPATSLAPLSAEILDVLFGEGTSQQLLGAPPPQPAGAPRPAGRPTPGPEPSPTPSPGSIREQITNSPDLRIAMSADRSTARPGDIITYTISWENAGRGRAVNVRIRAHIPEHTSWVGSGSTCVNPDQKPDTGDEICVSEPSLAAPPRDSQGHFDATTYDTARPGYRDSFTFTVLVDGDAASGFVIRNHAHISAVGVPRQTSNEVATIVESA